MTASDISHGHVLLADWLFLIAFALFVIAAVISHLAGAAVALKLNALTVALVASALIAFAWLML